jgi:hypothetical protein
MAILYRFIPFRFGHPSDLLSCRGVQPLRAVFLAPLTSQAFTFHFCGNELHGSTPTISRQIGDRRFGSAPLNFRFRGQIRSGHCYPCPSRVNRFVRKLTFCIKLRYNMRIKNPPSNEPEYHNASLAPKERTS